MKSAGTTVTPANHVAGRPAGHTAELLVEGRIATGNPKSPNADAMAISGGAIVGIGTRAELEGLIGPSTKFLKPDGVVIPGLSEPHMHIWTSLLNLTWTDVSHDACATFDEVVATIKAAATKTAQGEYVFGKLFDPSLYPGEPPLTRTILNQAAPNNPVLVMNASMHYLYANSAALAIVNENPWTSDPNDWDTISVSAT